MGLLYTGLKIFHFQQKLESLARDKSDILAPLHIRLKPTNFCNHNCWYCAYRAANLQLGQNMSQRDHIPRQKMIELVEDMGQMGVKAVTFSGGGEPFCYPYLKEAALALAQQGISFASLTNGSRLEGELAEIFAHQATWVRISLDGWDEESYSAYRKVPAGAFTKLMSHLSDFKALGGACLLGVSLVVDQNNAPHVHELIRRLRDTGVDSVKVGPCIVSNQGHENNLYHQPIFSLVKEQVQRAKDEMGDDSFQVYDTYHTMDERFTKSYQWCPYLQILPVIGADLRVYSCHDKAYNMDCGCLGSIEEQSFSEFWFNGKEKFFSIDPSRDCDHHCVANGKNQLVLEYLQAEPGHLGFV